MKIGEILKQMYFRRKASHSAVSSQPANSVSVPPRRTHLVSKGWSISKLPKLNNFLKYKSQDVYTDQ